MDEFGWLDVRPGTQGVGQGRIERMKAHPLGDDKAWFCDGDYIWLRRSKANPATLERHDRFVANGDYAHVETQGDVEVWELQDQSQFKRRGGKEINLSQMDEYNIRRLAARQACKRDWPAFNEIMTYLRDRIRGNYGAHSAQADIVWTETYAAVMAAIAMRNGPTPPEVNNELLALMQRTGETRDRIITLGAT